jgi:hypothetical protein
MTIGTIALVGTLTSLVSAGGGSKKRCVISANTYGAFKVSNGSVVTTDSFTIPAGGVVTLGNEEDLYAVGTANGTISYHTYKD